MQRKWCSGERCVEVGMFDCDGRPGVLSSSLSMTFEGLNRDGGLVFLVGAFEVGDFVVASKCQMRVATSSMRS